jgi:hypothetical protein
VAQNSTKKSASIVTISRPWQLVFLASVFLSQLVSIIFLAWMFGDRNNGEGIKLWVYQLTYWLQPLAYFLVGLLFAWRRIVGLVPRLFWASFIATAGYLVYMASSAFITTVQARLIINYGPDTNSHWWSAFGWSWTEMLVVFALYCGALGFVACRARQK